MAAHAIKKKHHSGSCHQSGEALGEKSLIILTKIRQGRAISRASGESKPSMSPGRIRFLIIQNPIIPKPSRTATDSKVLMNTFMEVSSLHTQEVSPIIAQPLCDLGTAVVSQVLGWRVKRKTNVIIALIP